ncbi:MAG: ribosome maturation factor RimP [Bacteroidia bacterium]|nr:ribosome maturation factor RimP [Bacteroidia bacterium]
MDVAAQIREIAGRLLVDPGHFVVDVVATAGKGPGKLLVIVDGDKGISIDDCADLSRKLSEALDELNLVDDRYTLEVSTPGLDQPLKLTRQYYKNIGRRLKVKFVAARQQPKEGILSAVNDDGIVLDLTSGSTKAKEPSLVQIPFTDIDKAFVLITFNKIIN